MKKYPHSRYKEAHVWEDAAGKKHTYYTCKRCGKIWGDTPSGIIPDGSEECPKGDYQHPKNLGADIYFSVHIPEVYLVSRKKGEEFPANIHVEEVGEKIKDKIFDPDTTMEFFALWNLKVTDNEKQRIISKYYLGDIPNRPEKAHIYYSRKGYHEVPLFQWKWDPLTIDWKKVLPKSAKEQTTIDWKPEQPLEHEEREHQGWDYTHTFKHEGSYWYRVYVSSGGDSLPSQEEEKTHRISIKGKDENEVAKIAASYKNVPYVKGGETYQGGVDCSGLACAAMGIEHITAQVLHDTYLRPNTDNDKDQNGKEDNLPEPWEGIKKVEDGDMWYVDIDRLPFGTGPGYDQKPVDHMGIYTAYLHGKIIHASGDERRSKVVRDSNPKLKPFWNGRKTEDNTIFRGSGPTHIEDP